MLEDPLDQSCADEVDSFRLPAATGFGFEEFQSVRYAHGSCGGVVSTSWPKIHLVALFLCRVAPKLEHLLWFSSQCFIFQASEALAVEIAPLSTSTLTVMHPHQSCGLLELSHEWQILILPIPFRLKGIKQVSDLLVMRLFSFSPV